jgi:ABC-2 type transport system ATP-binding protein
VADALGELLPDKSRAALSSASDRLSIPAPDGANTLAKALRLVEAANIQLADIALRRPSLDEVFLALTDKTISDNQPKSAAAKLS